MGGLVSSDQLKEIQNGVSNAKCDCELFDPRMTIVAIGLPYWKGKNLGEKVAKLINTIKGNPPPGGDRHLAETSCLWQRSTSSTSCTCQSSQTEDVNW